MNTRTLVTPLTLAALALMIALQPLTAHGESAAAAPQIVSASELGRDEQPGLYIVQLRGEPLALAATLKGDDGRPSLTSAPALQYAQTLAAQRQRAVARMQQVAGASITPAYTYEVAFNGLAVELTSAQASRIAQLPEVVHIEREQVYALESDVSPAWIGANNIWSGAVTGTAGAYKGEGVVVGIIDSGINTTHPSFAALGGDGYQHRNPLGAGVYRGACDPRNLPSRADGNPSGYNPAISCNDKLIGAWTFAATAGVGSPAGEPSPNDNDGHGSHTASIVAGNVLASATLNGQPVGAIAGIAPHANIIAYDVCGYTSTSGYSASCPSSAILAAINQAVLDRVDVINYSISGGAEPWGDAIELAFLGARAAGVVVSASAGNSGPSAGTVAHVSPWLLSVAATTHNRVFQVRLTSLSAGSATLPDIIGAGLSAALGSARQMVYAGSVGNALCYPFSTAQAALVSGKIVICDRGGNGRVEKAQNVQAAGGVAIVLANNSSSGSSLSADAYPIPGLNISYADGQTLKAWLASNPSASARISGIERSLSAAYGDVMASFSSRGPALGSAAGVLKPDIAAPGVNVLAAYANSGSGASYQVLSGTSMAAPQVAGAAALLAGLRPTWTPGQIQSALMTTALAELRREDGVSATSAHDSGAGRVRVDRAAAAGLVLDETAARFLAANPALGGDVGALNTPSMSSAACVLSCSWTRTVRSTLSAPATWVASGSAGVSVSPASFTIPAGGVQTLTITYSARGLPLNSYSFGRVTLTARDGQAPSLSMPIAARPVASDLPSAIAKRSPASSSSYQYGFSSIPYSALSIARSSLVRGTPTEATVAQGQGFVVTLTVPSGARRLVAELSATTAADADVYIFRDNGDGALSYTTDALICAGATSVVLEYCSIDMPSAGTYFALATSYTASAAQRDAVTLVTAVVGGAGDSCLGVSAPSASSGGAAQLSLTLSPAGAQLGDRYYGALSLRDAGTGTALADMSVDFAYTTEGMRQVSMPMVGS